MTEKLGGIPSEEFDKRVERLGQIAWIADAPMFVDERHVERFFDAVVRPKFEHVDTSEQDAEDRFTSLKGNLGLKGEVKFELPDWLKPLKPLSLGAEASGEIDGERRSEVKHSTVRQLKPIWTAERQLEELTRHYLYNYPNRVLFLNGPFEGNGWPHEKWWQQSVDLTRWLPRPLALLDFPPRTVIIPTAAEFTDGQLALLYQDLAIRLTSEKGGPKREYPPDDLPQEERTQQRMEYWRSFGSYFSGNGSREAMRTIEDAASKHGRISWIDFRILLSDEGESLHIHVAPEGGMTAGTFGYNFVRRGYSHGTRIVGTVKSGPDLNVLAIYER